MRRAPTRATAIVSAVLMVLVLLTASAPVAGAHVRRAKGAEDLAFRLTNCIRTGGHVTRYGKCKGWGSGRYSHYVPPLKRSTKISNRVSWPWARTSVTFYGTRSCWIGHSRRGSTVDTRFASADLRKASNGENMGCGLYGTAAKTTILIVRMWQAERTWRGPHWRQVKDGDFQSIGVGVAKYGWRKSQVLVDFYGKVID
jgi:hypothetical protein